MSNYHVICYYSNDDRAYLAFAPEYPGCVADGQTPEEARKELDIVVDMWREVAKEDGIEIEPDIPDHVDTCGIMDVAYYILSKLGTISTMALQKLLYYCLAWSLAWYNKPLFNELFEAWSGGPVNYSLFKLRQGYNTISAENIKNYSDLSETDKIIVDCILEVYGDESGDKGGYECFRLAAIRTLTSVRLALKMKLKIGF